MLCYDNSEMFSRRISPMANHKPLVLTSPKQRQGSYYEQQACEFLQAKGLILIAQNWQRPKVGELDLIMLEPGQAWMTVVFIEVRQRQRSVFGDAALSVTPSKQRKIIKTASHFLQQHTEYAQYDCRFDVVAFDLSAKEREEGVTANIAKATEPEWLTAAFVASAW